MNSFNGYPLFNDVVNPILKNWNRYNVMTNMKLLVGNAAATKYASHFSNEDKAALLTLANNVKINGYENERRSIMRANNA